MEEIIDSYFPIRTNEFISLRKVPINIETTLYLRMILNETQQCLFNLAV